VRCGATGINTPPIDSPAEHTPDLLEPTFMEDTE
jgi:hypothetical protein